MGTESLQQRAWLLHFASKVATLHTSSTTTISELLKIAKQRFGMEQQALISFLASVTPAVQEFASLLKVDIGQCPNYSAVIVTGCQELVRLSMETARSAPPQADTAGIADPLARTNQSVASSVRRTNGSPLPDFDMTCLKALPERGAWLNGYEVRNLLGRGAMGVVFRAFDPALKRHVAIKMMTPERVVMSEARDWFLREARAAAAIQHENVVTIYAVSEMNALPYLVMEYVVGKSLQDLLDAKGALPIRDVLRIGKQVANGLHAAHARRVVHRDIKPANILLSTETNAVKITDFGLARVLDEGQRSPEGTWVGTPQYMAPEQFNSADVDHRADLFSLGSLLYTLSTGQVPFSGTTVAALAKQIRESSPPPIRTLRPDVPAWLTVLISKLHSKLASSRCQSAAEVVKEFEQHP